MTTNGNTKDFPESITEAVDLVMSRMSEEMATFLRNFKGDKVDLHVQIAKALLPGMNVRAMLGLWNKNPKQLSSFSRMYQHPDDASNLS